MKYIRNINKNQKVLKKDKYFDKEIKEQFKNNIDILHNKFYDEFNENITFEQQYIIKKFVDFLKQNV